MSSSYVLPPLKSETEVKLPHFPTKMQAFVFRNWELVPAERIAAVLKTDLDSVKKIANDLGLAEQEDVSVWLERGYITVIKQNWNLIPYRQLLELLGWEEEKLAYILKEDDFLSVKLGNFKFDCPPIVFEYLTKEQIAETKKIAAIIRKTLKPRTVKPFNFSYSQVSTKHFSSNTKNGVIIDRGYYIENQTDFDNVDDFVKLFSNEVSDKYNIDCKIGTYKITLKKSVISLKKESHKIYVGSDGIIVTAFDSVGILRGLNFLLDEMQKYGVPFIPYGEYEREPCFDTRIIYPYHALYGNVFDEDYNKSFTDELFFEYMRNGVNGIWLQGVLYKLAEFPFDESLSLGYKKRQKRLKTIIDKAGKYGIKVYLYLNEPRYMPLEFFENYPDILGDYRNKNGALCISTASVQEYLYNSVVELCKNVPDIGGFFTITASENLTNCYSQIWGKETRCPRCIKYEPFEIFAKVNNIINSAAKSVSKDIDVIAWTWGWEYMCNNTTEKCITQLSPDITVMNTSEDKLEYTLAGVTSSVLDYTMSLPAPSEFSKSVWKICKQNGLNTSAKVQINTTWECPTVPYIPVFRSVREHIERLSHEGVNNLFLSWTVGGYPSDNIKIVSDLFFKSNICTDMFDVLYGVDAKTVKSATDMLSDAFKEFPFSIDSLYYGPWFCGVANLLFKEDSKLAATMTCFPYDDLNKWCGPYSADVLEEQLFKLTQKWHKGLELLLSVDDKNLIDVATACYNVYKSSYNQVRFARLRNSGNIKKIIEILKDELKLAENMYEIVLRRPEIGYEASCQYVYTPFMCLEKILNCQYLIDEYSKDIE